MKTILKIRDKFYLVPLLAGGVLLTGCVVYKTVPAALSVSDVVQMSHNGEWSKNIIAEMRKTHSVYMLSASEIAKLSKQGVQDSVLNYMEKTKTDAIRQNERMQDYRYWGSGWPGYWYGGLGLGWPYGYMGYSWGPTVVIRPGLRSEHYHAGGNRGGHR